MFVQTSNINTNMTPAQFTYWLQGFLELSNPKTLNAEQVKIIKDHLAYVFNHGHLPDYKNLYGLPDGAVDTSGLSETKFIC